MKKTITILLIGLFQFSCQTSENQSNPILNNERLNQEKKITDSINENPLPKYLEFFRDNEDFFANGFDFPVGNGTGYGYKITQKFGENEHLGEDWNAITGGNSDLGDSILSVADGFVATTKNYGGTWGNVIRIIHRTEKHEFIESIYGHCDSIIISEGDYVKKGQFIGTIGNVNGLITAHLHFEMRDKMDMLLLWGYRISPEDSINGYIDPFVFISNNRKIKSN